MRASAYSRERLQEAAHGARTLSEALVRLGGGSAEFHAALRAGADEEAGGWMCPTSNGRG